ncbi:TPA: hypothetical protein HA244_02325 [Candidatus Micrarchaeota archaeon]|nr:hypothetical protein [Candidatus Micrarchaeota archaeon]
MREAKPIQQQLVLVPYLGFEGETRAKLLVSIKTVRGRTQIIVHGTHEGIRELKPARLRPEHKYVTEEAQLTPEKLRKRGQRLTFEPALIGAGFISALAAERRVRTQTIYHIYRPLPERETEILKRQIARRLRQKDLHFTPASTSGS